MTLRQMDLGLHRAGAHAKPVTIIEPLNGMRWLDLTGLWMHRELLYFLLWRDIKGQYRQMALGVLWIILRPLFSMVVFTAIFGGIMRTPTNGIPYPLFFYSALVPWALFSGALYQSATSLTANLSLISKVYFPRIVVPVAASLAGVLDFALSFLILLGLCVAYGHLPSPATLLLPLFVLMGLATALGVGLWTAALSVKYRDVAFVLNYALQAWMYASPVVYTTQIVPEEWRLLYRLNPMTQVIDAFRWALYGGAQAPDWTLSVSAGLAGVLLFTGAWIFQRCERTVVDLV